MSNCWSQGKIAIPSRLYSVMSLADATARGGYHPMTKYTWETVGKMLSKLGLTLVSTKDEFENQTASPSRRKVRYYRNDDRTTIHVSVIESLQRRRGNKSRQDLMKINEALSVAMMEKHPKGENISQSKEKWAIRTFQSYLEEKGIVTKGTKFEELSGHRKMSIALSKTAEVTKNTLYRAIRVRSGWVEGKEIVVRSTIIEFEEIADSLDQGGSVVLVAVAVDTGEMLKLWFVYEDSEGSVSRVLRALGKLKFQPYLFPMKKPTSDGILFMSRFMYDPTVDSLKLAKAFDDWCAMSEGRPLDFWNHDRSQISHPSFRMASASFLSLRDSLSTCTLPNTSNDIILPGGDVVRYRKRNIKKNGQVQMRKDGSPPYNRNDVDVFIFPICEEGGNKEDKSSWTKVCIVSSREGINLLVHDLNVAKKRKGKKAYLGKKFFLATDQAAIVAELRRCKAVPQVSEEEIERDKEAARKYDRDLIHGRGEERGVSA